MVNTRTGMKMNGKADNIQRKTVKDFHKAWETIYI